MAIRFGSLGLECKFEPLNPAHKRTKQQLPSGLREEGTGVGSHPHLPYYSMGTILQHMAILIETKNSREPWAVRDAVVCDLQTAKLIFFKVNMVE
jgi:hypothetical protein